MTKKKTSNVIIFCILCVLVVAFLTPIFFVLINSFKGKLFISNNPFALPTAETFAGLTNYVNGIEKTGFFTAFGWSAFITVFSVAAIILFTSMTAYYLTRVKTGVTNVLYYMFVFSMIVPFQMVMFTMSKLANMTHLNNPPGMVLLYLGFGSGLSVFMFCGHPIAPDAAQYLPQDRHLISHFAPPPWGTGNSRSPDKPGRIPEAHRGYPCPPERRRPAPEFDPRAAGWRRAGSR